MKMRWHYTIGAYLKSIYTTGFIYPERIVLPGVRPIVWFTSSPVWEEMANKLGGDTSIRTITEFINYSQKFIRLTREETAMLGGGLFRVGVGDECSLHPFNRIVRKSKAPKLYPWMERALLEAALAVGSDPVTDWWGTFHPVPREQWKALEQFTPEGWQSFTDVEKIMRGEIVASVPVAERFGTGG
jgi:hypothetical protein